MQALKFAIGSKVWVYSFTTHMPCLCVVESSSDTNHRLFGNKYALGGNCGDNIRSEHEMFDTERECFDYIIKCLKDRHKKQLSDAEMTARRVAKLERLVSDKFIS